MIACMLSWRRNRSPSGQAATSRSVASVITRSYARIRSPWNGGSMSLRRRRCSSPSSRSSERSPRTGARTTLRPGAIVFWRSAPNSRFSEVGSETKTIVPALSTRAVKVSP